MDTTYLAQSLKDLGYTGVTGTTPYQDATAQQVQALQAIYNNALSGQIITRANAGAIHLNVNFDGTQNNKDFVPVGEFQTEGLSVAPQRHTSMATKRDLGSFSQV